jgi:translation initiation factor 2 alpha subunit (eIF-2alpha)
MDPALQIIMDHLTEVDSNISDIRADQNEMNDIQEQIKNDGSVIHDKVSSYTSDIHVDISAISAGQDEFEERMTEKTYKQMKKVATMVEQQAQKLREEFKSEFEKTRRDIEVKRRDILEATRSTWKPRGGIRDRDRCSGGPDHYTR